MQRRERESIDAWMRYVEPNEGFLPIPSDIEKREKIIDRYRKAEERLAEEHRLEQERLEKERLEQERIQRENALYRSVLAVHIAQLEVHTATLPNRRRMRQEYLDQLQAEKRRIEEERRQRQQAKAGQLH